MRNKPTVGQVVYVLNVGNAARHGYPSVLKPATVIKVGRKYFACKVHDGWELEFHLETWHEKTDYSPSFALYESEMEYADEKDRQDIVDMLYKRFSSCGSSSNLSLEALRKIRAVVLDDIG